MTTEKYTAAPDSISNLFVHLTNSSVQKARCLPAHAMPAPCRADGCAGGPKFVEGGTKCSLVRLSYPCVLGVDATLAGGCAITTTSYRSRFVVVSLGCWRLPQLPVR